MYRYKICNLLLFTMHCIPYSFSLSVCQSFVCSYHPLSIANSCLKWTSALLPFIIILHILYLSSIMNTNQIEKSLRVRNVDYILVHDSVNSNIRVLFVVYCMFFLFEHIFALSGIFAWNLIHFINSSHLINFIIRQNSIGIPIKIGPSLLATMFTSHRI